MEFVNFNIRKFIKIEYFFYLFAFLSAFSISASTILLLIIMIFWLFNMKSNFRKFPFDFVYFFIFYVWRGISSVLNGYFSLFFKAFGDIWDKTPYLTASTFEFDRKVIERFLFLLLVSNIIIFLYALGQKYLGFPIIVKQLFTADWVRFKGYHSHPLRFAGYLSSVFIIAYSFGVFYSRKYMYFSFIIFVALIMNGSRSYLFSVFLVVLFFGIMKSFRFFIISAISYVLLTITIFLTFPEASYRFQKTFNEDNNFSHMSLRENFWKAGFEISLKNPIYGVGAKMVSKYLEEYKNKGLIDNVAHCHNTYITYLAESGIIGVGLVIFIFFYFIRKYILAFKQSGDNFTKAFAVSLVGCWINVFLSGFFETNFSTFSLWSLLSLWMGIFESYRRS